MKLKIVAYFFLLTFSISACTSKVCERQVSSFDLNKNYEEELDFSACGLKQVTYHSIRISGEVYGDFLVGEYFKVEGKGHYDTLITADYYSDRFNFYYNPLGEVNGDLTFKVILE
ncbi:MAG: hypothetical protein P8O16_04770 [Algoriphagus sp.]|uniref:hypothetical protein n=1 Tax=Algoriphagus sp. TaxID=1872435 RepID=UPI00261F0488|nr:hypothetical protein [Algoriphagus sp.]MDG1276571.1 hypothetical protein [Algoriphagus sp.]